MKEHLTEQEVAQCAEAIREGNYTSLPHAIKEHLANCDDCATEVAMVAELANDIETNQKKNKKPIRLWLTISGAVAASLTLLIIGNYFLINTNNDLANQNNQLAKVDSTLLKTDTSFINTKSSAKENNTAAEKTVPVRKEILAAYTPNKDLEKLAENFKQTYRGEEITVETPSEINLPGVDSLKWINNDASKLTVVLLNNKGETVISAANQGNGIKIPTLTSGLYYWKLINEDFDLLFCGKIRVK